MNSTNTHERLDRHDDVRAPSERSFGFTFAIVFVLLAALSYWHRGTTFTLYFTLAVAIVFGLVALTAPRILRPLNLIWLKFGLLLHKVVNPVIMGLLFYGVFTPMGVVMRAFGVDFMHKARKPDSGSYWAVKADDALPASSMKNQF